MAAGYSLERDQAVARDPCLLGQVGGLGEADRQLVAREQEEAPLKGALGDPRLVVAAGVLVVAAGEVRQGRHVVQRPFHRATSVFAGPAKVEARDRESNAGTRAGEQTSL